MPLDTSIPLQSRVPSMADTFAPISSLLGIQQQRQQIQAGQIANQSNQALLGERTALRELANDPRVKDANGNVDPAKFATLAPQVAPTLGGEVSKGITGAQTATAANQATWFKLKGDQADKARQIAGGLLNDPSVVKGDSQEMVKKMRAARDSMIDSGVPVEVAEAQMSPMIAMAAHQPGQVRQRLMNMTQGRMSPGEQVSAGTPAITMLQTQGGIQPYNLNPNAVSMGSIGPQGAPMTPPNQLVQDTQGGTQVANPTERVVRPLASAPGSAPMSFPPGETAETQKQLQDARIGAQQQALNSGVLHDINRTIVSEVDKGLSTGKLGELTQKLASYTGFHIGTGEATDYNLLGKMLERSALTAAQGMGPHTNAGLEASIRANGSLEYTPQALRKIATLNDALVTGHQAYQAGLENAIKQGGNVFSKRDYDEKWSRSFDPMVFKLENALASGDKKAQQEILSEVGGPGSKGANELIMKRRALKGLTGGGQ
jgi:hypothetical protein